MHEKTCVIPIINNVQQNHPSLEWTAATTFTSSKPKLQVYSDESRYFSPKRKWASTRDAGTYRTEEQLLRVRTVLPEPSLFTYTKYGIQATNTSGPAQEILGPISSTSLRRVFVLKTSYEVRTLKIGFHQTIELCELLTFCRIFKTNI